MTPVNCCEAFNGTRAVTGVTATVFGGTLTLAEPATEGVVFAADDIRKLEALAAIEDLEVSDSSDVEIVIGGPPCQDFSRARRAPPTGYGVRMLNEFARVVTEAQPLWWLMENVPGVPDVHISGYLVQRFNLFAWEFGCRQRRNRSFQFGSRDGLPLVIARGTQSHFGRLASAVLAKDGRRNFSDLCELQGLPRWFNLPGLSRTAKYRAVGNGVPVPMARGVAEAIRDRVVTDLRLCVCGCGRPLHGPARQKAATAACRKRIKRSRRQSHVPSALCPCPGVVRGIGVRIVRAELSGLSEFDS